MLRITILFINLALVTGLFASEKEYTPFSGGDQPAQTVNANGRMLFDLGNLFTMAGIKGEGSITTKLADVSRSTSGRVTLGPRTVARTQSGSGEGGIGEDLFDQTAFAIFSDGVLENSSNANFPDVSFTQEIINEEGPLSTSVSSRGEFHFDIQAKNLTSITFRLPAQQRASLFTVGEAEGAVTVAGSFALFNEQDPISALASDTRSISFSSTGGVNFDKSKEFSGNFIVSHQFSKPFTGDLVLKSTALSLSEAKAFPRNAGAPEPSLFITMAASLAGLLAMRMRKNRIS